MMITHDLLKRFGACSPTRDKFAVLYPDGFDIAPLWGTPEEASTCWRNILEDSFLRQQVGWAILHGILPARLRADLPGIVMPRVELSGVVFRGCLTGADMRWANMRRANAIWARFENANLSEATFVSADLRKARFDNANLRGANMSYVDLYDAVLKGADLRYANLRGARLDHANMKGANLHDTILKNASLFATDFRGATLDETLSSYGVSFARARLGEGE